MLDRYLIKRLDCEGCLEYKERSEHDLELTNRRLQTVKHKQQVNPGFKSYDVWADGMVDIATRIEEQEAIKEELESDLELLNDRLISLTMKQDYPTAKIIAPHIAQLGFEI